MSPVVRAAIAAAEEMAAMHEARATSALRDLDTDVNPELSRVGAIGIAADVVACRREAARWREIAAVLREEAAP